MSKTRIVNYLAGLPESVVEHLTEVAGECGVSLLRAVSCERTTTDGIELWYDEEGCRWKAFVKGLGTYSGYCEEEAIKNARKAMAV